MLNLLELDLYLNLKMDLDMDSDSKLDLDLDSDFDLDLYSDMNFDLDLAIDLDLKLFPIQETPCKEAQTPHEKYRSTLWKVTRSRAR